MKSLSLIPAERIESKIYLIRGKKVMFDTDLAELYGVSTSRLNEQVKRNKKRFPEDFMFRLNKREMGIWKSQIGTSNYQDLRSQFVTSKRKQYMRSQFAIASKRNIRYAPYVFTEQGVAMLSSVLNSERAIQVNIQIMRTFTKIREMLVGNKELREKIESMEKKYNKQFKIVFEAIKRLLDKDVKPISKIGFRTGAR